MKRVKRLLAILLAASLAFSCVCLPAFAVDGPTLKIDGIYSVSLTTNEDEGTSKYTVKKSAGALASVDCSTDVEEKVIAVRIVLDNGSTAAKAASFALKLKYDANRFEPWSQNEFDGFYNKSTSSIIGDPVENTLVDGEIIATAAASDNKSGKPLTVLDVAFKVKSDAEKGIASFAIDADYPDKELKQVVDGNPVPMEYSISETPTTIEVNGSLPALNDNSITLDKNTVQVNGTDGGSITATAVSAKGSPITGNVAWDIVYPESMSEAEKALVTVAGGVITVAPTAAEGNYTVKAEGIEGESSGSATKEFEVFRNVDPTSVTINYSGSADDCSIRKPISETKEVTFTAEVKDGFGQIAESAITWSGELIDALRPAATTGTTISLDIPADIEAKAYSLIATTENGMTDTMSVNLMDKAQASVEVDNIMILDKIGGTQLTGNTKTYDSNAVAYSGTATTEPSGLQLEYNWYKDNEKLSAAPSNIGEYKLVVSVKADDPDYYGDSEPVVFSITAKTVTIEGLTANKEYDGTAEADLTGGTLIGVVEADKEDVTLDSSNVTATFADADVATGKALTVEGTFTLTGSKAGNYELTQPSATGLTGSITAANITGIATTVSGTTLNAFAAKDIISVDGLKAIANNGNALPETVTVAFGDNCTEELDIVWTADVTPTFPMKSGAVTFTGTPTLTSNLTNTEGKALTSTVTVAPVTLTEVTVMPATITKSKAQVKNADDLTALGLPAEATFKFDNGVADQQLTATWNTDLNAAQTAAESVTDSQEETVEFTLTTAAPDWATVDSVAMPKVTLKITNKFVIPETDITFDPITATYGDVYTPVASVAGKAEYVDVTYTYTYNGSTALPTAASTTPYKILVTVENDSYKGTKETDLTISPKELTISSVTIAGKTYDGTDSATITAVMLADGKVGEDEVSVKFSDVTASFNDANAGTEKAVTYVGEFGLEGAAKDNYTLVQPIGITGTISPRELTVNWTGDSFTYNGTTQAPAATVETGVGSETLELTVSGGQKDVSGTYQATASMTTENNNYTLKADSTTHSFAITPATYTVTVPDTQQMKVGSGLSAITVTKDVKAAGVNNERLEGTFAWYTDNGCTTSANDTDVSAAAVGATKELYWKFTPSANANYTDTGSTNTGKTTFTIVEGDPQVLTFGDPAETITKVYGTTNYTNAAANDQASNGGSTVTYDSSDKTVATVDANGKITILKTGTTTITASAAAVPGQFAAGAKSYTLIVEQLEAQLTWSGAETRTYDGQASAVTAAVSNLVGTDTVTVTVSGGTEKTAGAHTATADSLDNANYKLPASTTRSYTIEQKEVAISGLTAADKVYDGTTTATVSGTPEITGAVSGDTLTVTNGTLSFADPNVGENKAVTFIGFVLGGADAANYKLSAQPASVTATISPKEIAAAWSPASAELAYTGAAQNVTATLTDSDICSQGSTKDTVNITISGGSAVEIGSYTATASLSSTNYKLSDATASKSYQIVNAIVSATAASEGGRLAATVDGLTIRLSGYVSENKAITVTPAYHTGMNGTVTAPEVTTTVANGKVVVNESIEYVIDVTNVAVKPSNVTIENVPVPTLNKDGAETGDVAESAVDQIVPQAPEGMIEATSKAIIDAGAEAAKNADETATVTVQPFLDIQLKEVTGTDTSVDSIKLEITPKVKITVSEPGAEPSETEQTIPDSDIQSPITLNVELPFGMADANLFAKHQLPSGENEYLPVTVSGGVASWEMSSFFEVELVSDSREVSVTYTMDNGTVQTVAYKASDVGATLPTDGKSGYTFNGWKFYTDAAFATAAPTANGTYKKLTDDLLTKLAGDGSTFYAKADFTRSGGNTPPSGGGSSSGGSTSTKPGASKDDSSMRNPFVDVKASDYYFDAVLWAAKNKITGGVDYLHFAPNAACTRAQMVTFLWRAAGSPEPQSITYFTDVKSDAYYAKAVAWAKENNITGGTGNGKFSPDAACTRAQTVTFLYRFSGGMQGFGLARMPFTDVNANAYYYDAVQWAVNNSITGGTTPTTFSPNSNCTRAQIVTFLYRFFK